MKGSEKSYAPFAAGTMKTCCLKPSLSGRYAQFCIKALPIFGKRYPYTGVEGFCRFKPEEVAIKVLDSVNITLGDKDELKHAVGIIDPVSVAFEVVEGFRFYKGVYTNTASGNTEMI